MYTQDPPAEKEIQQADTSRPDRLHNTLLFGETWADSPCIHKQAILYPDTVRAVDIRYMLFDVSDKQSMDDYSRICMENADEGRRKFTSSEVMQWDPTKGTWLVVVQVTTRMFLTKSTSSTNPDNL